MHIKNMNWMDVEASVGRDKRCILPIGSTEQHAQLSLCVDMILAERVALEAASPLGVPVFPVMPYGLAPYFASYPGTITLRVETLLAVVRDVVASLYRGGFRRVLIVNGHGGNQPVAALASELMLEKQDLSVKFHSWWSAPRTFAKAQSLDPSASHANWMENFAWTRLDHAPAPDIPKSPPDMSVMKSKSPDQVRELLRDGSFGGPYQIDDAQMDELWSVGVEEVREALVSPWPHQS